MNFYSLVSIATTVLTFIFFIGIVVWAYGRDRRRAFDEAANAPFALPDEVGDRAAAKSEQSVPRS